MGIKSLSYRKAQSSIEFVFLLLFVLFIATLVVVLLQQNLDREIERLDRQIVQEFRNVWYEEIQQARESTEGYSRVFEVNSNPRGFPITSRLGDDPNNETDELVLSYKDYEFLFFLPTDVDYTDTGQNISLSEGVKVSRRCQEECKIFLYTNRTAPGDQRRPLDNLDTGLGSINHLSADPPLVFAGGTAQFKIINATDPRNLTVVSNGTSSPGAQFGTVTSYGDIAFLPREAGSKVNFVNYSDPSNPTTLSEEINFVGSVNPKILIPDYPFGYLATDEPALYTYSLLNWSDVREIDKATPPSGSTGGEDAAYDPRGFIYTAPGSPKIRVYDVQDRLNTAHNRSKSTATSVNSVSYRDETLYAVLQDRALVYDASNTSDLTEIAQISTPIDPDGRQGTLWRDYWFIANGEGYDIFDVSDPSNPEQVFSYDGFSNAVTGIEAGHDALYLAFDSNASVGSYY